MNPSPSVVEGVMAAAITAAVIVAATADRTIDPASGTARNTIGPVIVRTIMAETTVNAATATIEAVTPTVAAINEFDAFRIEINEKILESIVLWSAPFCFFNVFAAMQPMGPVWQGWIKAVVW